MVFGPHTIHFPEESDRYLEEFVERFDEKYKANTEQLKVGDVEEYEHQDVLAHRIESPELQNPIFSFFGSDEDLSRSYMENLYNLNSLVLQGSEKAASKIQTHLDQEFEKNNIQEGFLLNIGPNYGEKPPKTVISGYTNPEKEVFSIGKTPLNTSNKPQRIRLNEEVSELVEDDLTIEEYVSDTFREIEEEFARENDIPISKDWNIFEGYSKDDMEELPLDREKEGRIPTGVNSKYDERKATLYQAPASRFEWIEGSEGFLRAWRVDDGNIVVEPVDLEGEDVETVERAGQMFEETG